MTSDSDAVPAPAAGPHPVHRLGDIVRDGAIFILLAAMMVGFTLAQPCHQWKAQHK